MGRSHTRKRKKRDFVTVHYVKDGYDKRRKIYFPIAWTGSVYASSGFKVRTTTTKGEG